MFDHHLNCIIVPLPPIATPTLRHLVSIHVGRLNIIQSIGIYPTLGMWLLEDFKGVLLDALMSEHQYNAEAITRAIFQRWITGTGRKPITWRTLVENLRQWQYFTAQAKAIEAYC